MPESDTEISTDLSSRQTPVSPSFHSRGNSATQSNSRINTASGRKTITRSGRKSRQTKRLAEEMVISGDRSNKESDTENDNDGNSKKSLAAADFLDFGGLDIYANDGWDTDLEEEPPVEKDANEIACRMIYLEACKARGVIPTSYFVKHLCDSCLNMKHHGLGPTGMKPIAMALVTNTMILNLNLEDNWLDVIGGRYVCEMLTENCYITHLDLTNNRLGVDFSQQFVEVLAHNSTLTHVTLSENFLNDKAAEFLAEAIWNSSHIEYLDVRKNQLGETGGIILGPALAENSSIRYLDLSWNNIRRKGAVAIAHGIKQNVLIQTLNLSWNGFGVDGAKALGEALKNNSALEDLDISNNRFTAEAAVLLGKGISLNDSLKVLKIGKNPMQSAGCYAICAAITRNENCILRSLDFSDILVNNDFFDIFKKVKEQIPKMHLHHGGDGIPNRPKARVHPLNKVKNYLEKYNIRPMELFNDSEHSMRVSRIDFVRGIQSLGIHISDEEIEEIIDELDVSVAGNINYSELILGSHEFTEKEKKMATTIMSMKDKERKK